MLTKYDKNHQRKIAKEIRATLVYSGLNQVKSSRIVQKIINSKEFINSKDIALYYPLAGEIDLRGLLNVKGKNFYLPRCIGNEMEFVLYQSDEFLIDGDFKVKVPIGPSVNSDILDIIYIPALMANRNFYRLGYGRGFYDRFLSKNALHALKYIVVASELISSDFIQDEFDYKCDGIISA
ncbi:5-formyltetrahydrofolate cyclo-ligase [bacterium]|nr:5-formyltetrahydrofolate cyclo-ligase [bacterium]